jgi:NADPH:quinone reductase-like Zn-dependent oxidoreductase
MQFSSLEFRSQSSLLKFIEVSFKQIYSHLIQHLFDDLCTSTIVSVHDSFHVNKQKSPNSLNLKMKAALVANWTSAPALAEVPDLPSPAEDSIQLRVLATGIHRVVRSKASGKHYSAKTLPHLPGVDGVGEDPKTGEKYYFSAFAEGSFAEYVNVERKAIRPLPKGADPVAVAALMNPALSSWMALAARTVGLEKGFTVVILGVTSASGRISVNVARARGAGRIIGVARNENAMATIEGLDETIVLKENPTDTEWDKLGDVDVILDYVYGEPALALLSSLKHTGKEIQYVHLGSLSGAMEASIPGGLLRSKMLSIRGSGPGAWSMREMAKDAAQILDVAAKIKAENIHVAPLTEIEKVWADSSLEGKRIVITP